MRRRNGGDWGACQDKGNDNNDDGFFVVADNNEHNDDDDEDKGKYKAEGDAPARPRASRTTPGLGGLRFAFTRGGRREH